MSQLTMPEVGALSEETICKEGAIPQLPPLAIDSMSLPQLQEFLTCLMNVMTAWASCGIVDGGPSLQKSHKSWLQNLSLHPTPSSNTRESLAMHSLREVVSSCYRHLGQEALLRERCPQVDWKSWLTRLTVGQAHKARGLPDFPVTRKPCMWPPERSSPRVKPFVAVYVCISCDKEFPDKEKLRQHQAVCDQPLQPSPALVAASPRVLMGCPASTESLKSKGRRLKKLQIVSVSSAASSAVRMPSKMKFTDALGLIPLESLESWRASHRGEVACEKLDLEEPETPVSPTSPRTPRLLISQLSRDGEAGATSRRRLSYLQPPPTPASDSESTTSSEDHEDLPPVRSLLSIDFSSLLGRRVAKHLKQEDAVNNVVRDLAAFCRTPVKNHFLEKLRLRTAMYPVTYRSTKKRMHQHCHSYKFKQRQRQEFMEKMKTGLNRKSRKHLATLRKCSVVLHKLSKKELSKWLPSRRDLRVCLTAISDSDIQYWSTPRTKMEEPSIFPATPLTDDANVDMYLGLHKTSEKGDRGWPRLSLSHLVSEDQNAEVVTQKRAVYHTYLSDVSHSRSPSPVLPSSSKPSRKRCLEPSSLESLPDPRLSNPLEINIPSQAYSSLSLLSSPSGNRSSDESISILSLSSSDESSSKNPSCCFGCRETVEMKSGLQVTPANGESRHSGTASPAKMRRQSSPAGSGLRVGGTSPGGLGSSASYSLRSQDFKTRSGQLWGQVELPPWKRGVAASETGPRSSVSSSMPTLVSILARPPSLKSGKTVMSSKTSPQKKRKVSTAGGSSVSENGSAGMFCSGAISSQAGEQTVATRRSCLLAKSQADLTSDSGHPLSEKMGLQAARGPSRSVLRAHSISQNPDSSKAAEVLPRKVGRPPKKSRARAASFPNGSVEPMVQLRKSRSKLLSKYRCTGRSSLSKMQRPPSLKRVSPHPSPWLTTRASSQKNASLPDVPPKLEKMTESLSRKSLPTQSSPHLRKSTSDCLAR